MRGLLAGLARNVVPFLPDDEEELYGAGAPEPDVPPPPPPPTAAEVAAAPPPTAPAPAPEKGGFLNKLGKFAFSPGGLLALGTTFRAAGGNDNAFSDQQSIIKGWDARRKEDDALADMDAKNKAMTEAWVIDPTSGKQKYDQAAHMAAMKKYGVKGDQTSAIKDAKELRDTYSVIAGERGKRTAVNLNDTSDRQELAPGEAETQTIKLADGREAVIERDAPGAAPAAVPGAPGAAPAAAPPASDEAPALAPTTVAAAPQAGPTPDALANRQAIAGIESRGNGNYKALGPVTKRGDRAYGRYQVMGANIPSWTQEVLGRSMKPLEFLADQKAQDAVFDAKFGQFAQKYGSPEEAASVWFTGQPMAKGANRRDSLGTSGSEYVQQFSANRGAPRQVASAGAMGTDAAAHAPAAQSAEADYPPAQPGWHYKVAPTKREQAWEDLTPAQAQARGWTEGQRNRFSGETRGTAMTAASRAAAGGAPVKLSPQDSKYLSTARQHATDLASIVPQLERFGALNREVGTGGLSAVPVVQSTLAALDPRQAEMKSIQDRITPLMRQGLPGSASNFDVQMFQSATVGLGKPGPANEAVRKMTAAAAARVADYAEFMEEYAQQNGNLLGGQEEWDAYAEANPMYGSDKSGKLVINKQQPWRLYFADEGGGGDAPPASALKEGVVTTFKDGGGSWKLQGGRPVRVGE